MAATPEAICNQAMGWLGANLVSSITTPTSKEEKLCAANFEPLRDAVLAEHDWQFAVKRVKLTTAAAAPTWGYTFAYTPPTDMIKPIEVREVDNNAVQIGGDGVYGYSDESRTNWSWEGGLILVSVEEPWFLYVSRITDTTVFPAWFDQVLAQRLAADLAIPLTKSRTMQEQHWQLYVNKRDEAIAADGVHSGRRQQIHSAGLRRVR